MWWEKRGARKPASRWVSFPKSSLDWVCPLRPIPRFLVSFCFWHLLTGYRKAKWKGFPSLKKYSFWYFPGSPKDSVLSLQGGWIRSLVRELTSQKLYVQAKKIVLFLFFLKVWVWENCIIESCLRGNSSMHSLHNLVHWSWDFHSHCEFFQETVCLGLQGSLSKPSQAKSLMVRCTGLPYSSLWVFDRL